MVKRQVIVYSTKGEGLSKFADVEATTLEELIVELSNRNYVLQTKDTVLTESVNKTTLGNLDSKLPETDFTLFVRPQKTKSGADFKSMSHKELKTYLTENPEIKDKVNNEGKTKLGKNWTQLTTEDLRKFTVKFSKVENTSTKEETTKSEEIVENVEEVVKDSGTTVEEESVKDLPEESNPTNVILSKTLAVLETVETLLKTVLANKGTLPSEKMMEASESIEDADKNLKNILDQEMKSLVSRSIY